MIENHAKLHRLPLGTIRPKGWLAEQLRRNIDGMGGHLDELEPAMIATPYTTRETHKPWGKEAQAGWGAEISGNYWTGLVYLAFGTGEPAMIAKADKWVEDVLKNRRPDGYLGTYTDEDNLFDDYNAWGNALGMNALLAYAEATGREDVFDAVYQCMLWFCENWAGDKKTRYAGITIVEPMVTCYRKTGDRRLLDFCHDYFDFLEKNDLFDISLSAMLSPELHYASQHGSACVQDMDHPALLYACTGDETYLRASINYYQKLYAKAIQAHGGVTCESEYIAPRGAVVETEYCGITYNNKSLQNLLTVTGEAHFADDIEKGVFNVAQGARKKDEKAVAYLSSPNQIQAHIRSSYVGNHHQVYAPCVPVACCAVNSVRILPEFLAGLAMHDGAGTLYWTTYAPASLTWQGMDIALDTLYPFRDKLTFTFHGDAAPVKVTFRKPGWCDAPALTVNGQDCAFTVADGWLTPAVAFGDGDTVVLTLPMGVTVETVDDGDRCGKFPVTVHYGPLLYALEVPGRWDAYKGEPATPLPEGWHWYYLMTVIPHDPNLDIYDDGGMRKYLISWNVALDEHLDPAAVTVEPVEADGYVWEEPYVRLHVPAYKAPYSYPPYGNVTLEPQTEGGYAYTTDKLEITLVPYGCTNLRISYFPRAGKNNG